MPRPTLPPATPSVDEPDDVVTGKMAVVSEARQSCPACNGKILLSLDPVEPGTLDVHHYGSFRAEVCLFCAESYGLVTAAEAETIRAALKKT